MRGLSGLSSALQQAELRAASRYWIFFASWAPNPAGYGTLEQAALAAADAIIERWATEIITGRMYGQNRNFEWASNLYKDPTTKRYSFTEPQVGSATGVSITRTSPTGNPDDVVATIHSHTRNTTFSFPWQYDDPILKAQTDVASAWRDGLPRFLVTPDGSVKHYAPTNTFWTYTRYPIYQNIWNK